MLVLDALQFATAKHSGQFRKVSNEPYITHPLRVSYLLASFKGSSKHMDELLAAALLHDTLEDTDTSFEELASKFGELVATMVFELTSDETEIAVIGKKEYLKKKMVGMSSYSLTIKLVDRLANIMDNPTQKTIDDTKEILKHLTNKRILTPTQYAIINAMNNILY